MTSIQQLSLSDDLRRLREENYDIIFVNSHLVMRGVPYVTIEREVRRGSLIVSQLNMAGAATAAPQDHQMRWVGSQIAQHDGIPLPINARPERYVVSPELVADYQFSLKKGSAEPYRDYYEMFTMYYRYIAGHAEAIDPSVSVRELGPYVPHATESIFQYLDTATSRAGIPEVTQKLELHRIAIVGLGGSGSYILDSVAKAPISEIHLYDGDLFLTHNAFRFPGAPSLQELEAKQYKVDYLMSTYSKIHRGIVPHQMSIDESSIDQLRGMDFVFLSIDSGPGRAIITNQLEAWNVPFTDIGMGLNLTDHASIRGTVRVTTKIPGRAIDLALYLDRSDRKDVLYRRNIQTVDLNMLNAALAVIRFKKHFGFYHDDQEELQTSYILSGNSLINDEKA